MWTLRIRCSALAPEGGLCKLQTPGSLARGVRLGSANGKPWWWIAGRRKEAGLVCPPLLLQAASGQGRYPLGVPAPPCRGNSPGAASSPGNSFFVILGPQEERRKCLRPWLPSGRLQRPLRTRDFADLVNKNIGSPVKFALQTNDKSFLV